MVRRSLFPRCLSLLAVLTSVAAQTKIIPTSGSAQFPACAASCAVLQQIQTSCFPPVVAATNQITYENCFCQSGSIQALYGSPDVLCTNECRTASDRALLQTWFKGFCASVGRGVDPLSSSASVTSSTPSMTVITITSTNYGPTASATSATAAATATPSWISTHWKWIVMIGVLIVGFGLITALAVWLKKRHRRKIDDGRAVASGFPTTEEKRYGARSATPELWGPHQHMAATHGYEYDGNQDKRAGAGKSHRKKNKDSLGTNTEQPKYTSDAISEIGSAPATLQKKSSYRAPQRDSEISEITTPPQEGWYEARQNQSRWYRGPAR